MFRQQTIGSAESLIKVDWFHFATADNYNPENDKQVITYTPVPQYWLPVQFLNLSFA